MAARVFSCSFLFCWSTEYLGLNTSTFSSTRRLHGQVYHLRFLIRDLSVSSYPRKSFPNTRCACQFTRLSSSTTPSIPSSLPHFLSTDRLSTARLTWHATQPLFSSWSQVPSTAPSATLWRQNVYPQLTRPLPAPCRRVKGERKSFLLRLSSLRSQSSKLRRVRRAYPIRSAYPHSSKHSRKRVVWWQWSFQRRK